MKSMEQLGENCPMCDTKYKPVLASDGKSECRGCGCRFFNGGSYGK